MKILHLCFDANFIENSISVFDHFYPNRNVWFIAEPKKGTERAVNKEGSSIYRINPIKNREYLQTVPKVSETENISIIVLHGLYDFFIDILKILFQNKQYRVYWLFWGYELYRALGYSGKMRLVDNESPFNLMSYFQPTKYSSFLWFTLFRMNSNDTILKELLPYINSFCFWLYEDYLLLQKYYPNSLKFKYFQYNAEWKNKFSGHQISERFFDKESNTIMINHQASSSGNHITVMKKLRSFDGIEQYKVIVPLSYGTGMVRRFVLWKGKYMFKEQFCPVRKYMNLEQYQKLTGKIEVAIFGQLRQEAAGNISFLLANGTKVFMRENNTLYRHYKKLGYIVFSFEHDLLSVENLTGLTIEEKRHNAELAASHAMCYEDFMPTLLED